MAEQEMKQTEKNKMQEIEIEKIMLSAGGVGDNLEKSFKLLGIVSGKTPVKAKSKKRIPAFGIRPGLEIGCKVTLRGKEGEELLKRLLETIDNQLKEKQFSDETFSFGISEYIEIPGVEYQRDIGIIGFSVTVAFKRKGKRVSRRKIKPGKIPRRHYVKKQEIIEFMEKNFNVEIEKPGGKE